MARSRQKYKRSRPKVRVGLPKKKPYVFKPAFTIPPKLKSLITTEGIKWDEAGTVLTNYKSFGVVSNPNLLGVRSRTSHIVEIDSLQVPPPNDSQPIPAFQPIDSGSDLEEDDLKSALGKKRRDGKAAPLQPLTTIQRVHIGRLIEKYGDDYQSMFMDTKLNAMQHSIATLQKLCIRYHSQRGAIDLMPFVEEDLRKIAAGASEKAKELCNSKLMNDVIIELVEGDPRNVLCEAVEKHQATILVVGSHGYGAI
ncbi:nucleolar-like protein [Tasmannia lanceolata]|uniref:nucleolar-like protein n=1 Tax=Tasmannia lanceolata TaxID=3420 RepID=UPI0040632299